MNKLFTKIVGGFLGLAMTIGVGVMVGNNANESTVAHATSAPVSYGPATFSQAVPTDGYWTGSGGGSYCGGYGKNKKGSFSVALNFNSATSIDWDSVDFSKTVSLTTTVKAAGNSADSGNNVVLSLNNTAGDSVSHPITSDFGNGSNSAAAKNVAMNIDSVSSAFSNITIAFPPKSFITQFSCELSFTEKVTVVAATGITLNKNAATIGQGGSETLTATVTPENATDKTVSWDVSPKNQGVTVANGVVNVANNATTGSYTITASANGGTNVTATCTVTVTAPVAVSGVTLDQDTLALDPGETETLTATVAPNDASNKSVTWESDDESVATVDGGVVTAVSSGSTTITVTTVDGGYTDTCDVTVNQLPTYKLIKSENDLKAGSQYVIGATGEDDIYFISTTQNSNNRAATTADVKDEEVELSSSMQVITLGGSSGEWQLIVGDGPNYLYTGSTSANRLQTTTTLSNNAKWSISVANTGIATIHNVGNTSRGEMAYNYNSGSPIFNCYASGGNLHIYKAVDTTESVAISENSISGLKGDPKEGVYITANNFTPSDIEVSYDVSGIVSITKGTIADDIIPLNITYTGVGSAEATITVKGGKQDYDVTLNVSVAAKPASMSVTKGGNVITTLELQNGVQAGQQIGWTGLDTDEQEYSIHANDVEHEILSGSSYVSTSTGAGTVITPVAVGTAVIRYKLKVLNTVYADLTVNVINDSLETAQTVTFATGMTPTQGDSPTEAIFTASVGNTHFGSTETIPLSYFTFSYENNSATAVAANMFAYDFSHGTTVDSTHKSQTIYVFCSLPTAQEGTVETSYSVVVTQKNDPLKSITLTNTEIVDGEVNIERNDSLQLTWALDPTNPTDGRDLQFSVDECDEGVDITVSQTGLIAVDANSGLGSAIILVEAKHNTNIYTSVQVNVALEDMTYDVNETISWNLVSDPTSLRAGDIVLVTGVKNDQTLAMGTYSSGNNVKAVVNSPLTVADNKVTAGVTDAMVYTLVAGTGSGRLAFKDSAGKYLNACSSGSNYMHSESEISVDSSFTIDESGNVYAEGSSYSRNYMRFNPNGNNDAIFACYASNSTTGTLVTFYKRSGGNSSIDVTTEKLTALFNAIHNNFGTGKTYEWSDSCAAFDAEDWALACGEITDLANYSDYKLNRAVADANGNEIEQFLAKYDFLVDKFTKLGYSGLDYLGRFANDGINHSMMIPGNSGILSETFNSSIIFVLVSLISVAGIGVVMYKRKQTNI